MKTGRLKPMQQKRRGDKVRRLVEKEGISTRNASIILYGKADYTRK